MGKLWDKGYEFDKLIEEYTVGNDYLLDERLVPYDVFGNMAHAVMLAKIGILREEELSAIREGLSEILDLWKEGRFHIKKEDEDVHTKVENYLTEHYGEPGEKIHTGRSRNDQILLDLRLYMKNELLSVKESVLSLCDTLLRLSEEYLFTPMPGYTHTRVAMPSTVGLWIHALYEALSDDVRLLSSVYDIVDQSPLGSAAGYGVPIPIDRELVADLLGFKKVQKNVIYTQNSRGKFELLIADLMEQFMIDFTRYAQDLIYFTMPQFSYFSLPLELLSGSSIMPQKKNPDMLELMRAKAAEVSSFKVALSGIIMKLPTGYSRDLQLTKGYLMQSLDIVKMSIKVMKKVFEGIVINEERLKKDMTKEIYATDYALSMVEKEGIPFRKAYKKVAERLDELMLMEPEEVVKSRTHLGTPGNLRIAEDKKWVKLEFEKTLETMKNFYKTLASLLERDPIL